MTGFLGGCLLGGGVLTEDCAKGGTGDRFAVHGDTDFERGGIFKGLDGFGRGDGVVGVGCLGAREGDFEVVGVGGCGVCWGGVEKVLGKGVEGDIWGVLWGDWARKVLGFGEGGVAIYF